MEKKKHLKRFTKKELEELEQEGKELAEELAEADRVDGTAVIQALDKIYAEENTKNQ